MNSKYLWVFGNAVQDITVDVDMEQLSRLRDANRQLIQLTDQGPRISPKLWLKTQFGLRKFGVQVALQKVKPEEKMYTLSGGAKYDLRGHVLDSHENLREPCMFLPCENISWGGGGTNVITFLRALTPDAELVPIRYTDIAMSRSMPSVIQKALEGLRPIMRKYTTSDSGDETLLTSLNKLYETNPVEAESITRQIARIAADYSPDTNLAVYLASLSVESVLYRPATPRFRRNWVFSRFRSAFREVNNKIILKGNFIPIADKEEPKIARLLAAHTNDVGAILINSLKDGPLFRAAYSLCVEGYKDEGFVAVLAMTETTHQFTNWMVRQRRGGYFPPFILVLNETEAQKLAAALGKKIEPFMKGNDLPNILAFAKLIRELRGNFDPQRTPRIYVTLGDRGSLGVDGGGHVVYVSSFSKRGATVYDTNACGDAYCATIALLEWAKRNGYRDIAEDTGEKDIPRNTKEMRYFMAVATAAAYCKATNRRGRVYAAELKELLQYNHLASANVWTVDDLLQVSANHKPDCVDLDFRLREPSDARQMHVSRKLDDLIM